MKAATKEMAELYRKGFTLQQIGDKFGMTREAVRQRLQKAGVARRSNKIEPQIGKIDESELRRLYESGESLPEIGKHFAVSYRVIREALKFYEIPERHRRGKWANLLRNLKIGESRIVESNLKHPHLTLHGLARRRGIKISVNKLGENQLRITRRS